MFFSQAKCLISCFLGSPDIFFLTERFKPQEIDFDSNLTDIDVSDLRSFLYNSELPFKETKNGESFQYTENFQESEEIKTFLVIFANPAVLSVQKEYKIIEGFDFSACNASHEVKYFIEFIIKFILITIIF